MKKFIILIGLFVVCSNSFALLTQANWRWRNDDGNETSATWKAAQNTQGILSITGEIWRLRLELYNTTGSSYPFLDTLQYATSTSGPWINIDTVAGSNAFMIAGTSAFVTQAEPTTAQLAGTSYTFSPGKIMVDSSLAKNLDLADQQRTELEWAIKSTSNILPNTTYYFREEWGGSINLDAAATYPSLITAGVLAVKFTSFAVSREGKEIKLQWTTASGQNISKFDVLRSGDGKTWKTIATVKGQNTSVSNSFNIYDDKPLSGINYYIIKQYEIDGNFNQSDVKFLIMPETKSIISVYPNPAHAAVSFSITNKGASNLDATLTNINGTIIHHEIFQNVSANNINKLNLHQQPAPGIYILKLKAQDISESVRLVIE